MKIFKKHNMYNHVHCIINALSMYKDIEQWNDDVFRPIIILIFITFKEKNHYEIDGLKTSWKRVNNQQWGTHLLISHAKDQSEIINLNITCVETRENHLWCISEVSNSGNLNGIVGLSISRCGNLVETT